MCEPVYILVATLLCVYRYTYLMYVDEHNSWATSQNTYLQ